MQKTKLIQFRVTKYQYERIRNNAESKGFRTISAYLRETALNKDLIFEKKFQEIYEIITKEKYGGFIESRRN